MEENGFTLEDIFETYFKKTYFFVEKRVGDQTTAEDITSLVWEKIYLSFSKIEYASPEYARNFIFRITKNTTIDYFRKKRFPTESLEELEEVYQFSDNIDPQSLLQAKENTQEMQEMLQQLPKKQGQCLEMKYFQGMKNKEIAKELELNESSIASNLHRGIQNLRTLFEK